MTLTQLAHEFLQNYAERRLRPCTVRGYRINLEKHILPLIGTLELWEITTGTLDYLNDTMEFSNKSKLYVHATLRKALNYAIRREYIRDNPYNRFDLPRIQDYKYQTLQERDIRMILTLVKEWKALEIPVTMALCYGLRRGECLGIIPKLDLDVINHILHIQRTRTRENGVDIVTPCKTKRSNRTILIQPEHVKMLLDTKEEYACSLTPSTLDKLFKDFMTTYDFPQIRFHDLRHSYATLMLAKGVNPKIVSSVLGHSDIGTTLDIYSHPDVSMQQICLDAFDILQPKKQKKQAF